MLYIINLGTSISFIKISQIFFGSFNVQKIRGLNNQISMFVLSIMCIMLGNFYIPLTKGFFGIDTSFVSLLSLSSWLNYLITLFVGYIIYKWIIEKDYYIIKKIRHLHISFDTANFMLIAFIFIMIVWSYL